MRALALTRLQRRSAIALWRSAATLQEVRTPSSVYRERVEQGELSYDAAQWRVARKYLDRLERQLSGYVLPSLPPVAHENEAAKDQEHPQHNGDAPVPPSVMVPRGLYVHGHVGTGKSMLMDLFFDHVAVERKRRVHFNKFMLEVHQRLQRVKKEHLDRYARQRNIVLDASRDAISIVAEELVEENHLLCFDEFQVTDIADAMIMRKLFAVFFSRGGVMVATSNTAPQDLYKNGTNREYFLPFLQQLAAHTKIVDIDSVVDHRARAEPLGTQSFFFPLSSEVDAAIDELVEEAVAPGASFERMRIPVMMGRHVDVLGTQDGVVQVTFDELCNTERGAADYKALCEHFHTVVLRGVPCMDMKAHDQARRFILLIDELYEHRTRFICSAEGPPEHIFQFDDAPLAGHAEAIAAYQEEKKSERAENDKQGIPAESSWDSPVGAHNPAKMPGLQVNNLCSLQDLKIAFKRAVSRLKEMQSAKYYEVNQELQPTRVARLSQV